MILQLLRHNISMNREYVKISIMFANLIVYVTKPANLTMRVQITPSCSFANIFYVVFLIPSVLSVDFISVNAEESSLNSVVVRFCCVSINSY